MWMMGECAITKDAWSPQQQQQQCDERRYHFDVALLREQPGFRVAKAYLDMKCAPFRVLVGPPPPPPPPPGNDNNPDDDDGGDNGDGDVHGGGAGDGDDGNSNNEREMPCSEFLASLAADGAFSRKKPRERVDDDDGGDVDGPSDRSIVLGMTACKVLGLIVRPPPEAKTAALAEKQKAAADADADAAAAAAAAAED
jgi:hypothetical protein